MGFIPEVEAGMMTIELARDSPLEEVENQRLRQGLQWINPWGPIFGHLDYCDAVFTRTRLDARLLLCAHIAPKRMRIIRG